MFTELLDKGYCGGCEQPLEPYEDRYCDYCEHEDFYGYGR